MYPNSNSYYEAKSLIHKAHPLTKLITTIIGSIATILAQNNIELLFITLYLSNLLLWSNIPLSKYFNTTIPIIIITLPIIIILSLCFPPFDLYIKVFIKIIYITLIITVSLLTTKTKNIVATLGNIFKPIPTIYRNKYLIIPFLSILTIPVNLSKELHRIIRVNTLRVPKPNILSHCKAIVTGLATTLNYQAKVQNEAQKLKLWNYLQERSNYILNKWQKIDTIILAINVIVIIITLIY